ncbi:MAG: 50S ribosomal protein L10 [Gammaproteobacteria bacterium]|nr:50S ribosomal protein L10 [Gammaproteobacteria bacterium]
MPLQLEEKQALVAEVNAVAGEALSCVGADYRGLTAGDMDALRKQARTSNVYVKVVKNSLAKRALEGTEFECMNSTLAGPLVLAFSKEEPGAAARIFRDFAKENESLNVTTLAIHGRLLAASELDRVASLPTREEALARLAGTLLAPVGKFVRTLAEPNAKLTRTLAAVRDQKQAA